MEYAGVLPERIAAIQAEYEKVASILSETEQVLINTLTSVDVITDADIAGYRAIVDGFQSQYEGKMIGISAFSNQVTTFLSTYKQNEQLVAAGLETQAASTQIQINTLHANRSNVDAQFTQGIESIERSLRNAQITYDQAVTTYNQVLANNEAQ